MRIGIFGGTFNPVHQAHLILAERCHADAKLDAIWFVPSAQPPHKPGVDLAPFAHRVEMLSLAIAGRDGVFRIETSEADRAGPSFTADTLEDLGRRHPGHEWAFIVGGDCLPDMAKWFAPERIVAAASILVVGRPGTPTWGRSEFAASLGLAPELVQLDEVASPQIDISSAEIRRRIGEGRSVRYLLPRAVEIFIKEKALYRGLVEGF